ncbi:MAG: DUF637 domain-containing protein, partial [Rickettsiales bacterium]
STLSQNNLASSLAESAVSHVSSTAVQSSINGDSFSDALESQGSNILIGTAGKLGANQIGKLAHGSLAKNPDGTLMRNADGTFVYNDPIIGKPSQLALHAILGCGMGAAGGGDCASGAVSGITGELTAEFMGDNTNLNDGTIKELAGLTGGLSAIFTGNAVGLSDSEVAENIFSGQRIGKNAAENNYLMPQEKAKLVRDLDNCGVDASCRKQVQEKYEAISKPRDEAFAKAYKACDEDGKCADLKSIHYDLRAQLTQEGNEYYLNHKDEFKKLSSLKSIFHTFERADDGSVKLFGQNDNTKYIHPILGYEVVLDAKGNIVTDPLNIGTYNFYNPSKGKYGYLIGDSLLHKDLDVDPYKILGNTPSDPTKPYQRGIINRGIGSMW